MVRRCGDNIFDGTVLKLAEKVPICHASVEPYLDVRVSILPVGPGILRSLKAKIRQTTVLQAVLKSHDLCVCPITRPNMFILTEYFIEISTA
jgi:hypothetical protein